MSFDSITADRTSLVLGALLNELVLQRIMHNINRDICASYVRPGRIDEQQHQDPVHIEAHLKQLSLDQHATCRFFHLEIVQTFVI